MFFTSSGKTFLQKNHGRPLYSSFKILLNSLAQFHKKPVEKIPANFSIPQWDLIFYNENFPQSTFLSSSAKSLFNFSENSWKTFSFQTLHCEFALKLAHAYVQFVHLNFPCYFIILLLLCCT